MFKYDEYTEIKKAYREHNRLKKIVYSLEKKIRPDNEDSRILADEAFKKWDEFDQNQFALIIFKTFKDIKPKLYHHYEDYFVKWEEVFSDEWEELDEYKINDLLGLVLEIGYGRYWLPDKYYDDKPILGCLPAPPTHTKDWGFGFKD